MNKKTKSSIILSSLSAIAVAGSLIAGATYALFTSESKVNIAVTSGKVDVTATVSDLITYSGRENSLIGNPDVDADNIKPTAEIEGTNGTFINGGTAEFNNGTLSLNKMTPGDKVTFKININNDSTVATKYRTVVTFTDNGLKSALNYNIGDNNNTLVSFWEELPTTTKEISLPCEIELPSNIGNDYQDKSCDILFTVEAIQGNAATTDEKTVEVKNEKGLRTALYEAPTDGRQVNVVFDKDVTLDLVYTTELYNHSGDAGVEPLEDYDASGDTLSHYKVAVSDWNLVSDDINVKSAYGANYKLDDNRIGRLVVKEGQNVVLDLNGHTLMKDSKATSGSWSVTDTNVIGNYGTLKITDSSENVGTIKGNGFAYCSGATIHNYSGNLTIENINVDGNAPTNGTGQYVICNGYNNSGTVIEGGTVTINSAKIFENQTSATATVIKNVSGTMYINSSTVEGVKPVGCDGGTIYIDSSYITCTNESTGYAVKADSGTIKLTGSYHTTGQLKAENGGKVDLG